MPRFVCVLGLWLALSSLAHAACSPQTVAGLQARGASAQLIAKMCGGDSESGSAATASNVCATNAGVCPYRGPVNSNCTCNGPAGPVRGIGR